MPSNIIEKSQMRYVDNLPLADPNFEVPGCIHVLLGSDIREDVMFDNRIIDNDLSIRESLFGRVVSEPNKNAEGTIEANHATLDAETNQLIARIWELKSVQERKHQTIEKHQCEKTTRRSDDGSFFVQMPFKTSNVQWGLSNANAKKRYMNIGRKLQREPGLHEQYSQLVQELLELDHLELIPSSERDAQDHFNVPHHCVTKDDSSTTKLRVVFDASAKSRSGFSLNNCLMVGPK